MDKEDGLRGADPKLENSTSFMLAVVVRFPVLPVRARLIYPFKIRMHNISVVINDN